MIHRPSALIAALKIRPPKRCRVETACAWVRTMALMTAVSSVLQARCEIAECAALRNQRALRMAESIYRSSYESYRSGSSLSDHAGTPELAALVEDLRYVPCECATSEDACPQDVGNLVASPSRAAELTAVNQAVTRNSTCVSFTPEHPRGPPQGAPWRSPLGRAARSQSDEGDETKKYAVECW